MICERKKLYTSYNKVQVKSQILIRDYKMHELKTVLIEQVEEVYYWVRNHSLYPTRISINVGYADSGGVRKQFTNKAGYQNTYEIINVLWGYLCKRLESEELYRTIGISFGKFIPNQIKQLSLFDDPLKIKTEIIENQLDVIRYKYGKNIVMRGSCLTEEGTVIARKNLISGHKA